MYFIWALLLLQNILLSSQLVHTISICFLGRLCNIVFKHKKGEKRKSGEKARLNPTPQHLPSLFSNSPEDACPFNAVARSPN